MSFSDFLGAGISYFFRVDSFSAKYGDVAMMLLLLLCVCVCAAAGYFCGCFNSAIFFSKRLYGGDIRDSGSGNAGMTNMFRVYGKKAGVLTFLGDVGKTIIAVCFGYAILGYVGGWLGGFFCMLGHMFPAFYGFKGGKGVICMFVTLCLCDWPLFVVGMLIFLAVLVAGRMVSLSSIMTALTMPLFLDILYKVFYTDGTAGLRSLIAVGITVCIVLAHRENIKRMLKGQEPKIRLPWEKKKDKENHE